METIRSAWKITLDPTGTPVMILDFGDRMEDEPSFEARRAHEVVGIIDSLDVFIRDKRNLNGNLRFVKITNESTDAAARGAVIGALISGLAKGKTSMRIDIQGDATRYFLAAQAIATSTAPRMRIHPSTAKHNQSYQITFTGLSEIAVPPEED